MEKYNHTPLRFMYKKIHVLFIFIFSLGFLSANATDYYWVNGSGNWNDASHWSFTSGGQGGAGVPNGLSSNVFFDFNSALTKNKKIYLNQNIIVNDFIVSGTENFQLISNQDIELSVFGSWNTSSSFRNKISGTITFMGSGNHVIFTKGDFNSNIIFNCTGSYSLNSDFVIYSDLKFQTGSFTSNGRAIKSDLIKIFSNNNNYVNLNNSIIVTDNFIQPTTHVADYLTTINCRILSILPFDPLQIRATNTCGTIPFTITTTVTTNYNGFGVSCNGANDATVCVTVTGGVGPFLINWLATPGIDGTYGDGSECFTNVGAGTTSLVVTDAGQAPPNNICGVNTQITEPGEITLLTMIVTDPSCNGSCDGTALPIIFNEPTVPIVSYDWVESGETTPTAIALCVGQNTLEVEDANGCTFDTTFFILTPTAVLPNVTTQDASCFGVCDGAGYSNPSGGNGAPYTFVWSNTDTGPGPLVDSTTGLCNGNYSVVVTDNNGCTGTENFTINEPLQIIVTIGQVTHLICNNVCTGAITTNTANGTPPYSYEWFDAVTGLPVNPPQTSEDASNLCAGTYYVQVTDANGCQDVSPNVTLTEPPAITITPDATDILCFGDCTGTLTATVSGGTPNYTYQWFDATNGTPVPGLTSLNENNICAGTYFLEVTDDNGCIVNSNVVFVNEPPELILSVSTTDILCNSLCTGTASASAVGGVGTYDFEWFNAANVSQGTGVSISNLCDGDYYVEVTDDNGCTDTVQFTITEPQALSIILESVTDVQCNSNCDGIANFDVTGGTAPYNIVWYDAVTDVAIGQTGTTASNLCPGTYYAIATDANNCTIQSTDLTVTEPAVLTVSVTSENISCFGECDGEGDVVISGGTSPYTIEWHDASHNPVGNTDPINTLCAGTYHAEITDDNGCTVTSADITIIEPGDISATVATTDVNCSGDCDGTAIVTTTGGTGPFTFVWSSSPNTTDTEIDLCAGNYTVEVIDDNACPFNPVSFTINQNSAFNFTFTPDNPSCFGTCDGSATVSNITGEGGIYTLDWSTSANTTPTEGNLCVGTNYSLTITDQNGCDTVHTFSFTEPTELIIDPQFSDPLCLATCNGTASANPTGGIPPYSYTWVDLSNNATLATTTDTITGLCDGNYEVTVTDANGCTETAQYTLTDPPGMTAAATAVPAACGAVCDGQANVVVTDNSCAFTIEWFNATSGLTTGQTTNPAIGLCAGNYYAVITDCNGCSVNSNTTTVTQTVVVDGTMIANDPSCFGSCDGSINLTPSGGNAPYTFVWFDQNTGLPIGQNVEDPSGLCAGDYYVIITEASGCSSAPIIQTLNEPADLTITLTPTDASCNGVCNGSATSTVVGGTSPYAYEWFNASTGITTGQTSANASNLCDGDYELVVTDDNGCSYTSSIVTINEPSAMTGVLSVTDASCFNQCDGSAIYTISGGTSPYTFTWSSSANTTDTEGSLCNGNYTVNVTDANGCAISPLAFTINEPTAVSGVTTNGSVLCNGDCNGSVSVVASGGTSPYTYLWNDPLSQTTPVASSLCDGTYDVTVTDANGCTSVNLSTTVTEPSLLTIQTITATDATCGGLCDGTATVTAAGGTGVYSYQWNDALSQTTQTAVSLCAGSYSVVVTDANGCPANSNTVTVNEPNSLSVSVTATDETCFNTCNGTVTAVISGGTGATTVQWDDPTLQTSNPAIALCGGTYTVDVTDANGCTASASGTINSAVDITATIASTDAQCGVCDGTATVTASGGTGTLDILWDSNAANQTTSTATTLCAGTYQVSVTDDNGCNTSFSAAVSNPTGETLTISATDASCEGVCDGTATVTFNCGTPACSIQWNDPGNQTTNTATGLCEGSYGVSVTNGAGCISAAIIDVEEPTTIQPNAAATDVICAGDCNGTASTNTTGGDGNYTWLWDDISAQTNPAAVNLCSGTYTVVVTDGNGCTGTASVIVNDPSTPLTSTVSSSDASCFGVCNGIATAFPSGGTAPYTYQWDDAASQTTQQATGLCSGTYHVTIVDASGCTFGPLTVTVSEPTEITGNSSSTNIDCNGNCNGTATITLSGGAGTFTYLWDDALAQTTSTATNLCAGTYIGIGTDINGCASASFTVTISEPDAVILSVTGTNPDCNGLCNGFADAVISGGTTPYTILWDDPSSQTTPTASNLCAGVFNIDVTDANGCFETQSVSLVAPTSITTNDAFTDVTCFDLCNGTASVNPSGGTAPYVYQWSDGSTTNSITALCPGSYDVDITDANGCIASESFSITEPTEITSTFTFANSTCGQCTGSAIITPAGGTPNYTYQWDAAAGGGTSQSVANLCAGVYSVDITDATGCSETLAISISDNNAETVTVTPTDVSCFGICDGSAVAVTACAVPACTFEWFDGSGNSLGITADNISNVCADDYFVEVTNGSGCITVENTTINEPLEIEGNGVVTDAACGTTCDGMAALNPTGGNGVFTYAWTDPASQTTQSATGLCGGNVDVNITSGGCTITETYFIFQPVALTAGVTSTDAQCNGDCDATAVLTVNDGTSPYTFLWDDLSSQNTQTAINLCAGNYNATITDDNGCSLVIPVTINEPTVMNASVSSNDVDCFGNCNGDATVVPSGGNSPYSVQWDDPALQTTTTATGLCAGTYSVIVTDANLCTDGPLSVTINENPDITVTASSTDVSCNGFCDGTISIVAGGGDGNYQYSIDGGATFQASDSFSNLCGGAYDVVVSDGNNCLSSSVNVNVNEPDVIGGTVDDFNATCGVNNGSANAIPTGGTPSYSFIWMDASLNPIGQTTQGATGLGAGIYNVEITDANGCTATLTSTISNFNAPVVTVTASTPPVCNGDCNGAIDITVTGGTPNYSYLWFAGGQTSEDLSNICAGTHTVQVTDAAGCIEFEDATLNENPVIDASFTVTDASCGACDGTAVVTPTGGDGNYSVLWTNGDAGLNASNLCAGAYGAQISDGSGCTEMINFAISNPTGPTGETILSTDVSCFGLCDGTADVTPIGGTAPYTFFWLHDGSTTSNVSNLCAGTYFCQITDANDCIRTTTVTIIDAVQITDSTVITPADCGVCNGGLQIFATGNGPFSYQWDAAAGNSTSQTVSNLCEGIYTIVVSDGNGCSENFIYSVNGKNAPQINATVTDANCNGTCDGTATVNINGGVGPFTETWMDDSGTDLGLSGLTVNTLCEGDYIVQIVDQATGCLITTPFSIEQPDDVQFSLAFVQDNSCFGSCDGILTAIVINGTLPYTYAWNDPALQTTASAANLCAGNYDVTVTDANGCSDTQSSAINEPTEITMTFSVTDASCSTVNDGSVDATVVGGAGNYSYSWTGPNNFTSSSEDLTNIFTGTYYLTVTDGNGCSETDSVFINALLIVTADAGNDTTICGNITSFTVNGNGGITYEWYDTTGVLLASTQSYTFTPVIGSPNTLILVAYDGLCTDSDTISVNVNAVPVADAGADLFTLAGIPVTIGGNPTGPSGTSFIWNPGTYADDSTLANPTVTIDTTTMFVVTVTDLNGCFASDTMIVEVLPPIFIPNGFSPNGDGPNDVWEIDYIEYFPNCQVEVYNRWGQLLFISTGYQTPWDGKYEDKEVPIGTYYYVINLNHPLFPDAYTGPLTILR